MPEICVFQFTSESGGSLSHSLGANGDKDEGMPAFKGRLTPEQINGLVRFIRAEFQAAGPKDGPGHK